MSEVRMVVGIMSQEKIRERALKIARREHKPSPDEPTIWFPSMDSLAQVLSDQNRQLIRMIAELGPDSITELARLSHRKQGNLSRTLRTLAAYGLVDLQKSGGGKVRPVARVTSFNIIAA